MNIDVLSTSLFAVRQGRLGIEFGQLSGDNTFCSPELMKQDEKNRLVYNISFADGEKLPILFRQVVSFLDKCVPDTSESWIVDGSMGLEVNGTVEQNVQERVPDQYPLSDVNFSEVDLSWVDQLGEMNFSDQYGVNQSFLARINDVQSCAICGSDSFSACDTQGCVSSGDEDEFAFGLFGQNPVTFHGGCFKRLLGSLAVIASEQSHMVIANNI